VKDGLIIRNVSHWMGEGEAHACVLAPLDHDFRPGRLCCVSGPSGTGKTTLLSILAAVVRPTHGRVLHAGIDLARATDRARLDWRRRELGLVFQTSRLIDVLTTAEHMALVARLRRAAVETMGVAWLHKLGLGHRLNNRPSALSGGEKQRVALAQALAPGPTILLADEPTAALDSTNASLVARVLADYAAQTNAVVVAVSHDPILLDAADDRIDLCRP
jgi:putative ABC transport system ATP-binding protein